MKNVYFYSVPGNRKTVLLHYKAIARDFNRVDVSHTNNWEISEIVRIFLSMGWNIELVDRKCTDWKPSKDYNLFISNASGSLGNRFLQMAKLIPDVKTVMYAAGPAVDVSDKLVDERYTNFKLRHNIFEEIEHLRTFRTNIDNIMNYVDEIICIDDNGFTSATYERFELPIHKLRPSSPRDSFDGRLERFNRSKTHFMLFLGNGFIAKGADVVLDSFQAFPNLHLEVCGPYKEDKFFWTFYRSRLRKMPNVNLNGFVRVGSKKYFEIISRSGWQIHNSAAEACATSVTTLIQGGVLPISNYETGVNIRDCGIEISNLNKDFIESTKEAIESASTISDSSFQEFTSNLYFSGNRFTQNAFRVTFSEIIMKLI